MENKTLFQIEQRIKKGCGIYLGEDEDDGSHYKCGEIEDILCPSCQREEDLIQEIKGMIVSLIDDEYTDEQIWANRKLKKLIGGKE